MTHRHLEGALTIREPNYQSQIEFEAYVRNRHPRDIHAFEPVLARGDNRRIGRCPM